VERRELILLRTVNLRKQFGETRACDGLDFVVNKGEFLSLVGSNGAGKTTLVNLISAHLQPDSGQILLEDRDITFSTVAQRIKALPAASRSSTCSTGFRYSTMSPCRCSPARARQ
jgi:ABC-type branched-subunit amino acid transport system ATPase component